jgi:hypothetical protein
MKDICPFHNGPCIYSSEIPEIPLPKVFFAYDSKSDVTDSIELYFRNILGKEIELIKAENVTGGAGSKDYKCEKICKQIKESLFVVADIGKWDKSADRYYSNPNVTFEVGLALGFNKPVILLTSSYKEIPSDFYGINLYCYNQNKDDSKVAFSRAEMDDHVKPEIQHILKENTYLPSIKVLNGSESHKIIYETEKHTNNRLLIRSLLSSVTRTPEILEKLREFGKMSQEECNDELERIKNFKEKLISGAKYIDIYNIDDVEAYLKGDGKFAEGKDLIKGRIKNIINFLKNNENYHIYLTDKKVEFDFELCDDKILFINGKSISRQDIGLNERNVALILFTIPSVITEFKKEFDSIHKKIGPKGCKDKKETINWFEKRL